MSAWLRGVTNQRRGPFLAAILRAAPMIAVIIIFTSALKSSGWLDVIETTGLDAMSREIAAHQTPRAQRFEHVTIVGIGDAEYKTLFRDTSPLDANRLFATIEKIESLHPAAIGVDVETASDVYANERFHATGTAPIVWATAGRHTAAGVDRLLPVLYEHRDLLRPIDAVGDAEFPSLNVDGVLRNYVRSYPLARPDPHGDTSIPSFATALASKFCSSEGASRCRLFDSNASRDASGDEPLQDDPLIDYVGECYSPASSDACVNRDPAGGSTPGPLPYMNFRTLDLHAKLQRTLCPRGGSACTGDPVFRDRVVLLGGFFTDGGDVHPTPFGLREGVEIWARTIDTEIDGTGRTPVRESVLLTIDILVAVLLTAVGWYFRFLPGLAVAVAVPIVLLAVSFAFFGVFGAWLDVIPMSVGVILHNLGEHGTEYVKLRRAEEAREENETEREIERREIERRDIERRDIERKEAAEVAPPPVVADAVAAVPDAAPGNESDAAPREASAVPPAPSSEPVASVSPAAPESPEADAVKDAAPATEAAEPIATPILESAPPPDAAPATSADSIR